MNDARRRLGALIVAAAALTLYFALQTRWPKDQVIHVVLGASAPRVTELSVRYAPHAPKEPTSERGRMDEDWTREATFRFPEGSAPRVVTHEARLADGDYDVQIDLQTPSQRSTIDRRVTLAGGTTSIDISEAVPR